MEALLVHWEQGELGLVDGAELALECPHLALVLAEECQHLVVGQV